MQDALKKVSRKTIQKTAETTRDIIGNKIGNQIAKVSKTSPHNSDAVDSEVEIPKESYTPPKKRQQIIDDLRLL